VRLGGGGTAPRLVVLASILLLCGAAHGAPALTNAFFAMDTGVRDATHATIQAQAQMLQELGYAGLGGSGYDVSAALKELETRSLKLFNVYLTVGFATGKPALDDRLQQLITQLKGHDTKVWLAVNDLTKDGARLKPSDAQGDEVAVAALREIAACAQENGVKIALYPHTGFWIERVEDALRVANKVDRPNMGVTFNLCHWLKVEGDRDPQPVLQQALSRLFFISINGADSGDTKKMNWDRLIQTLDRGSFDHAKFLRLVQEVGYTGPIGLQGYGIGGDAQDNLRRSMGAWRRLTGQEAK
jgi:sugar phosphate isomerase/epimerase